MRTVARVVSNMNAMPGTKGRWSMPFMLMGAVGCMSMATPRLSMCLYTGQNSLLSSVFWLMLEKR